MIGVLIGLAVGVPLGFVATIFLVRSTNQSRNLETYHAKAAIEALVVELEAQREMNIQMVTAMNGMMARTMPATAPYQVHASRPGGARG